MALSLDDGTFLPLALCQCDSRFFHNNDLVTYLHAFAKKHRQKILRAHSGIQRHALFVDGDIYILYDRVFGDKRLLTGVHRMADGCRVFSGCGLCEMDCKNAGFGVERFGVFTNRYAIIFECSKEEKEGYIQWN